MSGENLQTELAGFNFDVGAGKQPLSGPTAMDNLACGVGDEVCKLVFDLGMEIKESS